VLNCPLNVALDASGNLYILDFGNNRIREVSPSGIITTVAGNGVGGSTGDGGAAANAKVNLSGGIAVDLVGNVYFSESARVREISTSGIITTVAGNGNVGYSGDGGPAMLAQISGPFALAMDKSGNLYIADTENSCVREITASTGIIATVAGICKLGSGSSPNYSGDGVPATSTNLAWPAGVAVDNAGNLYIADSYNGRVRKVTSGIITTIAGGSAAPGYQADGSPAVCATVLTPGNYNQLAVNGGGQVYVGGFQFVVVLKPAADSVSICRVENAASNLAGAVAPGEIVVLEGAGLGPETLTVAQPGSDGFYDCQLSGTAGSGSI